MVLHILRGLFILLMAAVGWFYLQLNWLAMAVALSLGVLFVCIDIVSPRKKLAVFSGTLLGLVVGIAVAYGLHFAVELVISGMGIGPSIESERTKVVQFITLIIGLITCYLSISFTLQTKDDFRFIIPYVEFSKRVKGNRPVLVDTSVLIDGRIHDVVATGIIENQLVVPHFVLDELQQIADSGDKLKRNRGRRGLDVLTRLRGNARTEVVLYEALPHEADPDAPVDQKLMALAKELNARVLTNDYNLNKVAQLRGVDVINLNDLSNALKPVVLPGEKMSVRLVKPGESAGQAVGYLNDGTMVVVEQGRPLLQQEVEFTVTSALQTSAGRMIFGRLSTADNTEQPPTAPPDAPPRPSRARGGPATT